LTVPQNSEVFLKIFLALSGILTLHCIDIVDLAAGKAAGL